jgi:hypothetical protein
MKTFSMFFIALLITTRICAQKEDSMHSGKINPPWYVERFQLSGAFFLPVNNTNVQIGITDGAPGTDIDFQKDLGFTKYIATYLASFQWRISRRSRINLGYYDIKLSANHTLQKDIEFEGETYPIHSSVNSFFNTAIYQFSYGYAIISKPKYELGLLIGTHVLVSDVGLSVNGNAGATGSRSFAFNAPLPDLGVWGGYVFSNRLAVNLNVDYLSLNIGANSGTIFAYNVLFLYRLISQLNLSLGYSGLNFKVTDVKTDFTGTFRWGYNGPALGVSYSFGRSPWKK